MDATNRLHGRLPWIRCYPWGISLATSSPKIWRLCLRSIFLPQFQILSYLLRLLHMMMPRMLHVRLLLLLLNRVEMLRYWCIRDVMLLLLFIFSVCVLGWFDALIVFSHFALDIWEETGIYLFAVIVHFIDKDWILNTKLAICKGMELVVHTCDTIREMTYEGLHSMGIGKSKGSVPTYIKMVVCRRPIKPLKGRRRPP